MSPCSKKYITEFWHKSNPHRKTKDIVAKSSYERGQRFEQQ
ncbi:20007_t:CDS:2 [Gigaspora rosea]|nr:20007_t:CDS:2 [Gigaspora rosea]